jgi:hypothetical protein
MSSNEKIQANTVPRKRTRREKHVKTQGLDEEKYVFTHSLDQVYITWSGEKPNFALYTKFLEVKPSVLKSEGIWGYRLKSCTTQTRNASIRMVWIMYNFSSLVLKLDLRICLSSRKRRLIQCGGI